MVRAKSRFEAGWLVDIADEQAAKEHAEELVQDVLRKAEAKYQFVASHESDVKLVAGFSITTR